MPLTTLKFNVANTPIRHEVLHGRSYIVAPMAMLTEGVHNGSGGPLLYKADEIKRAAPAWNMKPIVVYHPQINGRGVSACDRDILEAQQVGMVMNARWDGKLRAEAWIDENRARAVDARVLDALLENKVMEVSTGLFTENLPDEGVWNEGTPTAEPYTAVAVAHQPDHLALLPDQIGACSVADGAGLLQMNEAARAAGVGDEVGRLLAREFDHMRRMVGNAMSYGKTTEALRTALKARLKPSEKQFCFVVDVYDDFVIYEWEENGTVGLFRLDYTATDAGVELSTDAPVPVVRVTEYRTQSGEFVGNMARKSEENTMDRQEIINGLIANEDTEWDETDRETLEGMNDAVLNKVAGLFPKEKKEKKKGGGKKGPAQRGVPAGTQVGEQMEEGEGEEAPGGRTPPGDGGRAGGLIGLSASDTQLTTEEYINNAPPEIREVLTNGLAAHEAEKAKLIDTITANKANAFTKEFLATKGLGELRGLAALAAPAGGGHQDGRVPMFYGGAATPSAPVTNVEDDDYLPLPVMNFTDKAAG